MVTAPVLHPRLLLQALLYVLQLLPLGLVLLLELGHQVLRLGQLLQELRWNLWRLRLSRAGLGRGLSRGWHWTGSLHLQRCQSPSQGISLVITVFLDPPSQIYCNISKPVTYPDLGLLFRLALFLGTLRFNTE